MSKSKYAHYKDSGMSWVGTIPLHWAIQPLLSIGRERNEANIAQGDKNLLSLSYGRIVPKDIESNDGLLPASFETYQIVHIGDLIVRLTDLQNDKRSLRSAIVDRQGIITSAYLCVTPTGILPTYFGYLFRSYDLTKVLYSMGGGLRQSLRFFDLKRLPIVVPPREEQDSIVALLDCETGKLDALIAEQEKLLKLLAEKRQAMISHAIYGGLNSLAPMQEFDAGVTTQIPAHWKPVKIKRVIRTIEQGWSPQCEAYPIEGPHEWGVLKVGCVNGGIFNAAENKKLPAEQMPITAYSLRKGDLLISRANARNLVGSAAMVPRDIENILLCDKLYRLRLQTNICCPRFLATYLSTREARSQIESQATGASSSMLNIGQSVILDLVVALPPIEEQKSITDFIDVAAKKFHDLQLEVTRAVELLKERRSVLIAAAVTGKIYVRDYIAAEESAIDAAPIA